MNSLLLFGTAGIVLTSVFGALLVAFIVYLAFTPLGKWFTALFSGAYIPTFKLISLKNRKLNVAEIVDSYILAKKSGISVKLAQIESLYCSGGNVNQTLSALNLAKASNLDLSWEQAVSIELSTKNILEMVQNCVNSRSDIIENISAFAIDGKQVIVDLKISTKVNFSRCFEGLGLQELKDSVASYIIERIAKTADHADILTDPSKKLVEGADLEFIAKLSKYDLLDMNVVRVDIGRDLKNENYIRDAEKEKAFIQVGAEKMKAVQEIKEYKMRTRTEEKKSAMLEAESEVPLALAQAIREGRFSVMDYYKLMNLQADTALRKSIIKDAYTDKIDEGEE